MRSPLSLSAVRLSRVMRFGTRRPGRVFSIAAPRVDDAADRIGPSMAHLRASRSASSSPEPNSGSNERGAPVLRLADADDVAADLDAASRLEHAERRLSEASARADQQQRLAEDAEAKIVQLTQALHNARRIGTAIGILMALRKVTEDGAFELLKTASQVGHRKLFEVAEDVIQTGTLA